MNHIIPQNHDSNFFHSKIIVESVYKHIKDIIDLQQAILKIAYNLLEKRKYFPVNCFSPHLYGMCYILSNFESTLYICKKSGLGLPKRNSSCMFSMRVWRGMYKVSGNIFYIAPFDWHIFVSYIVLCKKNYTISLSIK